ncbi:MAG: hypothetical protein JXB38_00285 [Anaerolineales bacterium]|nr:hypothetical protein [Anaerolineales bacterium]
MTNNLDLASLFQSVTSNLLQNKDTLNKADTYNHDHGDNMVQIFEVITEAMQTKQGADPADQLEYASQLLRKKSQSGTAQFYVEGLSEAAQKFTGQAVTPDNATMLVQSLLGVSAPQSSQSQAGGMLGSLLSGLTGGGGSQDQELDAGDLLNAGLAFMQSKQQGESTGEALMDALVAGTAMGQTPHRAQSGALVANTLMQVIGSMGQK